MKMVPDEEYRANDEARHAALEKRRAELRDKVVAYMREADKPCYSRDVAGALGVESSVARVAMKELATAGRLVALPITGKRRYYTLKGIGDGDEATT